MEFSLVKVLKNRFPRNSAENSVESDFPREKMYEKSAPGQLKIFFYTSYHPIPWRDSISRPIAPISWVAGGDGTPSARRRGQM
jgi:hypothetical protein